jgi:hypothetical protein
MISTAGKNGTIGGGSALALTIQPSAQLTIRTTHSDLIAPPTGKIQL